MGSLEVVTFSAQLRQQDLEVLAPILSLAPPALLAAEDFEQQRHNLLDSVHRMTQLYDLEKSLNATLDLDAVIALIPVKVGSIFACQAIHLWLFDGGTLRLVSSRGTDPTVHPGMEQFAGEGYVADMAEEGEPLLIADSEDPRLQQRNRGLDPEASDESSSPVRTALLVPLLQDESEVGVLEAINKDGGHLMRTTCSFCRPSQRPSAAPSRMRV